MASGLASGMTSGAVPGPSCFEDLLAEAGLQAAGPVEGLFGPDSVSWQVLREMGLLLGGGRALLLQLAHPGIAAAVAQHSTVNVDPIGRGRRTFEATLSMAFGDLETAQAVARRVHRLHGTIRGRVPGSGTPYDARDPALTYWVLATLIDTTLRIHDALVSPLSERDRARFYEESKIMAGLFGIPRERVPADLGAFAAYFQQVLDGEDLAVGPVAAAEFAVLRDMAPSDLVRALLPVGAGGLPGWLPRMLDPPPARRLAQSLNDFLTAGLLPPRLRAAYGLPWPADGDQRHRRLLGYIGHLYRRLPDRWRFQPAYRQALDRIIAQRPHPSS